MLAPALAKYPTHPHPSSFWYARMDHTGDYRGYAPHLDDASTYQVYMAVKGNDGDAIQAAINARSSNSSAQRKGQWLASQPRVVYIPPGTYEVRRTINMTTDTIVTGDPLNPPIIKAAAGFDGDTLINGQDPTTGISGEISFAVGLKNLVLDTTEIDAGLNFTGLYWGVGQVAQLSNIDIKMPPSVDGSGHSGVRLGRGSTLTLADIRVEKGLNGIFHDGHQQALYKNIYFSENTVGMLISSGFTITILNAVFDSVGFGVKNTGGSPFIGLVDCKSINSGVTFSSSSYPSMLIDNLDKDTDSNIVELPSGVAYGPASHVDTFTWGNTVDRDPIFGPVNSSTPRSEQLAPGGRWPAITAPSYAGFNIQDFINIKDPRQNGGYTVKGDASVDETDALNKVLQYAVDNNKVAYFPYGDYRVHSTLVIPLGSRIVGEAWSAISAAGDYFKDSANPKPIVQVGEPSDVGRIHISDIRVSVAEVLPGAIMMQFNAAGAAPGDVAIWNSAILIGGTRGVPDLIDACGDSSNPCKAVFLGLHFAKDSSVYLENFWNWVADHITEDFAGGSSIAGKAGALVETDKGTWLHGLGSEHWWLYQLNLRQANNVLVTLLQSETNYEQGDNAASTVPAPWTPDVDGWGDPDYSWCAEDDKRCRMGFSNYIQGGSNIWYYGSASWVFFSGPGYQSCAGAYQCQKYIHWIEKTPKNFNGYGFCAKDVTVALRLGNGTDILSQEGFTGSWGSVVGRYTPANPAAPR
ncbi:hypothetical protein NM208_g2745 [Fusarium decemcellulare]|uniref:Uncharacterized protein n=1 Tax=Fusarium decemcellulare TaxID=57161 RepID=A0ACC1SRC6_9HYPO|nr:hypothetical protein NM208_g2745 [Fusarium decemcellulare]